MRRSVFGLAQRPVSNSHRIEKTAESQPHYIVGRLS
jgi:hypothetical protein